MLGCGAGAEIGPGFEGLTSGSGGAAAAGGGSATNSSAATGGSGGTAIPGLGPPYPIVLTHGFFGFNEFAGVDFAEYYFGVKEHLADEGEALVYTPAVDPFNTSAFRGAQLAEHIDAILADTGHAKVIIIGHSQGGLDARVVAHDHPDMVAAVVTLASPHGGTPIADIALGLTDNDLLAGVLDFLLQTVGTALYDEIGNETDVAKGLNTFSTPGIEAFNAAYPDAEGVYYASIAGRSDWHYGGDHCDADSPDFIQQWNSELDPIDPLFDIPEQILDGGLGNPYPNDGLARVIDCQWGEFLGCVPADHLDLVGQLFGDNPGFGNQWRHLDFYADLVTFLRDKGY